MGFKFRLKFDNIKTQIFPQNHKNIRILFSQWRFFTTDFEIGFDAKAVQGSNVLLLFEKQFIFVGQSVSRFHFQHELHCHPEGELAEETRHQVIYLDIGFLYV